jgi:ankyrin repeat protein
MKKSLLLIACFSLSLYAADPEASLSSSETSSDTHEDVSKKDLLTTYCSLLENISIDNLNKRNKKNGMAPFHFAIQSERPDAIAFMLRKKGINLNIKDKDGNTPLILATQLGNPLLVTLLLYAKGTKVDSANKNKQTALIIAGISENRQIAQLLVDHKANRKKALKYAEKNNNEELTIFLQEQIILPEKKLTLRAGLKQGMLKTKDNFKADATRAKHGISKAMPNGQTLASIGGVLSDGIEAIGDALPDIPSFELPSFSLGSFDFD